MRPNQSDDPAARRRLPAGMRWLLLARVPSTDRRVIDVIALMIGFVVACFVCLPILIVTILGAYVGTAPLAALGVSDTIRGALILVVGFGGGLLLSFVVLLRISRRLPAAVREVMYEPDDPDDATALERLTTVVLGSDSGLLVGFGGTLVRTSRRLSASIASLRSYRNGRPGESSLADRLTAADARLATDMSIAQAAAHGDEDEPSAG